MFVLLIWLWSMSLTAQSLNTPELNALQDFGRALRTSNWDLSTQPDPCNWDGISCNRSKIAEIRLSGRGYEGSIPSSICNLSALTNLQLYKNKLTGNIPSCIGQLKSLQKLGLGTNLLNGSIPAEIGSMSSLLRLHLDNNYFTGSIPSSIANLTRLQVLLLATNSLTGTIPAELGRLKHLKRLWLHANKLSGEVPQSFAKLRSMADLTLSYNLFAGNISFIQGMPWLQRLWLNGNSFNGQVPNVSLVYLHDCDLGFNQFNGTIPEVLAVSSLQRLLLGHNRLEGSLPLAFGNLPTLSSLDVSHNSFTGSTRHLDSIKEKDISFNYFEDQNGFLDLNCNASSGRQDPCFPSTVGSEGGFWINAGGEETIVNGMIFKEDRAEVSMGLYQIGNSSWLLEVSGFKDKSILERGLITAHSQNGMYGSARWSPSYLAYHGTKLTNGNYNITLYFTEMLPVDVGQRVFDVIVQGKLVLMDLDLRAQVTSPFQFMVNASVTNGTLSIELKGKHYNFWYPQGSGPIISAISVSPLFQISEGTIYYNAVTIGFSLILFVLLAIAVYMLVVYHTSSKNFHVKLATESDMELLTVYQKPVDKISGIGPTIFTYQEMWKATNGFDQKMLLGKGGFGAVYKGVLPDGTVVAVKQLSQISRKNGQNFKNEIAILSMLQHRNLLGIKGYCLESKAYLLVCDYMENGSLEKALFHGPGLDWATRRKVAIGTACGLQYLHEESKYHVVHCDVKPANILLDKDMNACVADFGLATFLEERISQTVENRVGTFGYMAPEYIYWNELSEKVDVYSFGVVLLGLLSGKYPTWPTAKSHNNVDDSTKSFVRQAQELVYAQPCKLVDLIDERLDGLFDPEEAIDMSNVALLCTQESPSARPRMRDVWLMLSQTIEIPTLTIPKATARRS